MAVNPTIAVGLPLLLAGRGAGRAAEPYGPSGDSGVTADLHSLPTVRSGPSPAPDAAGRPDRAGP